MTRPGFGSPANLRRSGDSGGGDDIAAHNFSDDDDDSSDGADSSDDELRSSPLRIHQTPSSDNSDVIRSSPRGSGAHKSDDVASSTDAAGGESGASNVTAGEKMEVSESSMYKCIA